MDGRVFCVHGGLSPNLHSIDQVQYRFCSLYLTYDQFFPIGMIIHPPPVQRLTMTFRSL